MQQRICDHMATTARFQRLDTLVSNLGLCSRREANNFIRRSVTVDGVRPPSQALRVDPKRVLIDGKPAAVMAQPIRGLAVHKPAGYVCSRARDADAPTVFELLPPEWVRRRPELVLCGRLDKHVTGLVMLTQDGQVAFEATARGHEREYQVTTELPIAAEAAEVFASGTLVLEGETTALLPAELRVAEGGDRRAATLVVREGRYHQVRRMMAATGNRVVTIRRVRIGGVTLEGLAEGQHRLLTEQELASVTAKRQ